MPKLRKPVDLGFRVPAKLADQIRAQAVQEGRSAANLVRAICQAHFDTTARQGRAKGPDPDQLDLPLG